jgi:hypothetical protein
MEHVDIGALLSAIAIFFSSFPRTKSNAAGERRRNRPKPEKWVHRVSCIAFLQACMFIAVAIACEAAGTRWIVGVVCLLGSSACLGVVYFLNSSRLKTTISSETQTK